MEENDKTRNAVNGYLKFDKTDLSAMMDLFASRMPLDAQLNTYISLLARVQQLLFKKIFSDLPLKSLVDYYFLVSVRTFQNPKKSELISFNQVEFTTGTDIMHRLKREGLLTEYCDTEDKRCKRIKLTEKGLQILSKADELMKEHSGKMLEALSEKDQNALLKLLQKIKTE